MGMEGIFSYGGCPWLLNSELAKEARAMTKSMLRTVLYAMKQ